MSDEEANTIRDQSDKSTELEDIHYSLLTYISKQNQARAKFVNNVDFGEPIWDFLLDLMASEHLDRPSSNQEISQRLGIPETLTQRCAGYLLVRGAIFENRNKYSVATFPWLVSDETKIKIKQWLNVCISEAPSDKIAL